MNYPQRKSYRLAGFDYSSANYYYITICTAGHRCLFGMPNHLNTFGQIAHRELEMLPSRYERVNVDKFIIMPNHIHVIFALGQTDAPSANPSIADVVGKYKAGVSRLIHKTTPEADVWQSRYYDEIIRDERHYLAVWNYIDGNPLKWEEDKYFSP